jgi:hypothetical protein
MFEIYRKIISIEQLDMWNIHTNGGILLLKSNNPKINELLRIIMKNKRLIFDCVRENKKFYIIDIKTNKLRNLEATIINFEKEKYTENIHIITDPFRMLILNKNYTDYNKLYNKLKVGNTYLFILNSDNNQLLDVKKTLKRIGYIEVLDMISINSDFEDLDDYIEIKTKNTNGRFLYDSFLNIGCEYKITYSKSFSSNLYKIIRSEIVL